MSVSQYAVVSRDGGRHQHTVPCGYWIQKKPLEKTLGCFVRGHDFMIKGNFGSGLISTKSSLRRKGLEWINYIVYREAKGSPKFLPVTSK